MRRKDFLKDSGSSFSDFGLVLEDHADACAYPIISAIYEGSMAKKLGLKVGDLLFAINKKDCHFSTSKEIGWTSKPTYFRR